MVHTAPAWMMWLFVFYYIVTKLNKKKNVIFLWVSTYCVSPGASHAFHFLLFFLKPSAILFLYFIVEMLKKQKMIVDRVTRFFLFREGSKTCAPHRIWLIPSAAWQYWLDLVNLWFVLFDGSEFDRKTNKQNKKNFAQALLAAKKMSSFFLSF